MNRIVLLGYSCLTFAFCALAFGQEQRLPNLKVSFQSRPAHGALTLPNTPAASAQLPTFAYTVSSSRDGNTYSGVMVGDDPFSSSGSVSIPTELVPIILNIGGTLMDPTVPDTHCLGGRVPDVVITRSPIFQSANFSFGGTVFGGTQYIDAFQRANFFSVENQATFHTKLQLTTLAPILIDVPPARGATVPSNLFVGGCPGGVFATVDINWFAPLVEGQILPSLLAQGLIGPGTFPIFMIYSTGMTVGPPGNLRKCCVGGFHSALLTSSGSVQTFAILDFDTTGVFGLSGLDTAIMSHEVGEWMDDPLGGNPTPAWGHTGQVVGCQNNLEVGDPLTGNLIPNVTLNGYTYHLQELAFFSWFYGAPSIALNGMFSDNGTFKSDAGPVCASRK